MMNRSRNSSCPKHFIRGEWTIEDIPNGPVLYLCCGMDGSHRKSNDIFRFIGPIDKYSFFDDDNNNTNNTNTNTTTKRPNNKIRIILY